MHLEELLQMVQILGPSLQINIRFSPGERAYKLILDGKPGKRIGYSDDLGARWQLFESFA